VPVSATEQDIRASFAEQAGWCEKLGADFTAGLCRLLGERLDRSTEIGRRVLDWPGNPSPLVDNVPLRLCGGLQALVRGGRFPGLAACYPPNPDPGAEALWRMVAPALDDPSLPSWLDRTPQTNEVGRSSALFAALLVVADRFPLPMALLELGASAGLNLLLDRYSHRLGTLTVGDLASPLRLVPDWEGGHPPPAPLQIASRIGVDIAPLDVRADAERLIAYVWPDQPRRQTQLAAALAIAAADPPRVEQGDAASWLDQRLAEPAMPGITRIALHSVAFHYFPPEAQARIAARMAATGARSSPDTPLAWLRYEQSPGEPHFTLRLHLWPGDEERLLAECHPHGRWIRWL
jgi:hypothetical protein